MINGKHNKTYSSHSVWLGMKKRCLEKNDRDYHLYGGRGITVCDRWRKFKNFYADMGDKPEGRSIDRIDSEGDYCPENCRWATAKEQSRNKRNNHRITYKGETLCIAEWVDRRAPGVTTQAVRKRIARGWDVVEALTRPTRLRRAKK